MSDRMEQAWCEMVADAAWDASGECPLPGSDVIVWAHQQMSALEAKLAAAEADADRHAEIANEYMRDADELRELSKFLPGTKYMDPPDGGDVTIAEQFRRMAEDAERYRWLRESQVGETGKEATVVFWWDEPFEPETVEQLDAAIDAARSAK